MSDNELKDIWRTYDQKMNNILAINKELVIDLTKRKLNKNISALYRPKATMILIGLPYTLILYLITFVSLLAGAYLVAIGFGLISLVMTFTLGSYVYHLYLIRQVNNSDDVIYVQRQLAKLKISSFNNVRVAIIQLPFWSVCWVSLEAHAASPILYGGINFVVFLLLSYLAYWLYRELSCNRVDSKVRQFFLSGVEWDPILKSSELLEQIKEYEK